jgi:hypothetical protein
MFGRSRSRARSRGQSRGGSQSTPVDPILASFDFTALTAGEASSLPGGLLFARSGGGYSVQTGTGTVVTGLTTGDRARIGRRSDSDPLALVIEPARTNLMLRSREVDNASWNNGSGTTTTTADAGTSPDGTTSADRSEVLSGAFSKFQAPSTTNGVTYTATAWMKRGGASDGTYQLRITLGSASVQYATGGDTTSAWQRVTLTGASDGGGTNRFIIADGADRTANGGVAAGARDVLTDLHQLEAGAYCTEPITTTTAAVTRNGERLYYPDGGDLIDSGRIGMLVTIAPKGSSTQYAASMRLWTIDADNYAEISNSTGAVSITIDGDTFTTGSTLSWARHDVIDLWIEAGGGATNTVVKARINGGSTTTIGTSGSPQDAIAVSGAIDLLCDGTSNQFGGRARSLTFYRSGSRPSWAA